MAPSTSVSPLYRFRGRTWLELGLWHWNLNLSPLISKTLCTFHYYTIISRTQKPLRLVLTDTYRRSQASPAQGTLRAKTKLGCLGGSVSQTKT